MGGVPVLMLIAATGLGITDGWQAEQNCDASEPVVRVSQDQTPSNRVSDYHRRLTATAAGQTSAMKPDPQVGQAQAGQAQSGQNAAGSSGFGLPPSLSDSSLSDLGQTLRSNIDKAGREIKSSVNEGVGRMLGGNANSAQTAQPQATSLIEPPRTRNLGGNPAGARAPSTDFATSPPSPFSTPNFTTPPFTGGESSFGGPGLPAEPSTDRNLNDFNRLDRPSRDNQWGSAAAGQTQEASQNGRQANAPTTDPVGSRQLQIGSTRQPSTSPQTFNVSSTGQPQANGLRSDDTFARPPAGLTLPVDTGRSEYERMLADQRARELQRSSLQQPQSSPPQTRSSASSGNPATYREASATMPDTRLSDRQLNANAWFVDAGGRVLDRNGYLMAGESVPLGMPGTRDTVAREPRWQDEPAGSAGGIASGRDTSIARPSNTGQEVARQEARPAPPAQQDRSYYATTDPPSYSDFRATSPPSSTAAGGISHGFDPAPQVAAQPLFNGLLIISFVANVYLVFWLKNLRLQFRDKVASQRMANSGGSTA